MYKNKYMRHPVRRCVLLLTPLLAAAQTAPAPVAPSGIEIRIVQGDGAINSIRLHRGHDPVVQITDLSGSPLTGVTVTFLLPATGPGGTFQNQGLSVTTQSDLQGFAAAHRMIPNRIAGTFHIRVVANWRGQAANAAIPQTNADPVVGSKRGKKIAIIALIAGGVAGGAAAALAHGGSSSAAAAGGSTGALAGGTIAAGTPTIGPPH